MYDDLEDEALALTDGPSDWLLVSNTVVSGLMATFMMACVAWLFLRIQGRPIKIEF